LSGIGIPILEGLFLENDVSIEVDQLKNECGATSLGVNELPAIGHILVEELHDEPQKFSRAGWRSIQNKTANFYVIEISI
jgi:hypothetical protein